MNGSGAIQENGGVQQGQQEQVFNKKLVGFGAFQVSGRLPPALLPRSLLLPPGQCAHWEVLLASGCPAFPAVPAIQPVRLACWLCLLTVHSSAVHVQRHNPCTDRFPMHKFHHVEFWCGDATNTSCR
jgi:hypothetical protein